MLRISFKASRQLAFALVAPHGAALLCWLALPIPVALRIAGAVALAVSSGWSLAHHAWLWTRASIVALYGDADGLLQAERRDGIIEEGRVLGDTFVTPFLTIVAYKPISGRRRHVLIVPDKTMAEPYRQLRVWLKWRAGKGSVDAAGDGWASRV